MCLATQIVAGCRFGRDGRQEGGNSASVEMNVGLGQRSYKSQQDSSRVDGEKNVSKEYSSQSREERKGMKAKEEGWVTKDKSPHGGR